MVRLGEGENFGKVVVELRSTADPNPIPPGDASECSTKEPVTSSGLDVPDDPSQPVRTNACCGIAGKQL